MIPKGQQGIYKLFFFSIASHINRWADIFFLWYATLKIYDFSQFEKSCIVHSFIFTAHYFRFSVYHGWLSVALDEQTCNACTAFKPQASYHSNEHSTKHIHIYHMYIYVQCSNVREIYEDGIWIPITFVQRCFFMKASTSTSSFP